MINKIILDDKAKEVTDYWNPRILAELNQQHVKLAKLKGPFVWHAHENEDELFLVIEGKLTLEFRDHCLELTSGEMCVIPRGVEHRPVAENEVTVLLFEPKSTLNTGDANESIFTRKNLDKI